MEKIIRDYSKNEMTLEKRKEMLLRRLRRMERSRGMSEESKNNQLIQLNHSINGLDQKIRERDKNCQFEILYGDGGRFSLDLRLMKSFIHMLEVTGSNPITSISMPGTCWCPK